MLKGKVVIVDDVVTARTAIRESVNLVRSRAAFSSVAHQRLRRFRHPRWYQHSLCGQILDWKKRPTTRAAVRYMVETVLDHLPRVYTAEIDEQNASRSTNSSLIPIDRVLEIKDHQLARVSHAFPRPQASWWKPATGLPGFRERNSSPPVQP